MLCRSPGCGAEGLFDRTLGFCKRCYEELEELDDTELKDPDWDPTGYYERKTKHREETIPYLVWMIVVASVIVAGRCIWFMFIG